MFYKNCKLSFCKSLFQFTLSLEIIWECFSYYHLIQFSSVAQFCLTLCDPVDQHTRLSCSSPTPGACSNSCPLHQWRHPTNSSSVIPFSSCLQSFPSSGFFSNQSVLSIRWSKYWSFSFSISPSNEYSRLIFFRIDWLGLISDHNNEHL